VVPQGLHESRPGHSWSDSQFRPQRRTPAAPVHIPAEQMVHGGQAIPHPPQWRASVLMSTHRPPHEVRPVPHRSKQFPTKPFIGSKSHTCVVPQARLQSPQCAGSVPVSVHVPLPQVRVPEVWEQKPRRQKRQGEALQSWPHWPQCSRSFWRLAHTFPQRVHPVGQVAWHFPPTHTWPPAQARPHPLQFAGSVSRSTHWLPHSAWPRGHVQAPPEQTWLAAQRWAHRPQLAASALRSTQRPLQPDWPGGHATLQTPATQDSAAAHCRSHPPQWSGSSRRLKHSSPQAISGASQRVGGSGWVRPHESAPARHPVHTAASATCPTRLSGP